MKLRALALLFLAASFLPGAQAQDEQQYEEWMKATGKTVGSLRKNLEGKMSDAAAADAGKLEEIFKEVGQFWAKKNVADATKWSGEAQMAAKEVKEAASSGEMEKALVSMKSLGGTCASCHASYREKLPDGKSRIKL